MNDNIPFARRGTNVMVWPQAKIVQPENISIGSHVIIDDFCFIVGGKKTEIGDYVHIASYASVTGGGELFIGDFCSIAQGVTFLTGTDCYTGDWGGLPNSTIPAKFRQPKRSFIRMEKHSMIGQGSRVFPGVTIGEGCTVGAMSLVLKDLPPWTICMGIPAKPVKDKPKDLILRLEGELRMENKEPKVSICCMIYNQVSLVREAIESFLVQKTEFDYEILVHDDASTDGTTEILREYERQNPNVIRVIVQSENQYSKTGEYPLIHLYREARGKYIAECDGDDYWTDPLKLQKQVDFLEANPEYSMCHHDYLILENGKIRKPSPDLPKDFLPVDLINYSLKGHGIGLCTRMFRNYYSEKTAADIEFMAGDYSMNVYMGTLGGCKYIPGIAPSYYRRMHGSNSWCTLPAPEMERRIKEMQTRIYRWFQDRGDVAYIEMRRAFIG